MEIFILASGFGVPVLDQVDLLLFRLLVLWLNILAEVCGGVHASGSKEKRGALNRHWVTLYPIRTQPKTTFAEHLSWALCLF